MLRDLIKAASFDLDTMNTRDNSAVLEALAAAEGKPAGKKDAAPPSSGAPVAEGRDAVSTPVPASAPAPSGGSLGASTAAIPPETRIVKKGVSPVIAVLGILVAALGGTVLGTRLGPTAGGLLPGSLFLSHAGGLLLGSLCVASRAILKYLFPRPLLWPQQTRRFLLPHRWLLSCGLLRLSQTIRMLPELLCPFDEPTIPTRPPRFDIGGVLQNLRETAKHIGSRTNYRRFVKTRRRLPLPLQLMSTRWAHQAAGEL